MISGGTLTWILVLAIGLPAYGQTTRPASTGPATKPAARGHAELLAQARKTPVVRLEYTSPDGKALLDAQRAEIEESTTLLKKAAESRQGGDYTAAAQAARKALTIRTRLLGEKNYLTATAQVMALTLEQFAASSEESRKKLTEADRQYAAAEKAFEQGDYTTALAASERAVELRQAALGKNHPEVGLALRIMGKAQTELKDLPAAQDSLTRALELLQGAYGQRHPEVGVTLDRLGWLAINQSARAGFDPESVQQATTYLRRAVNIFMETVGETVETAESLDNLGTILAYSRTSMDKAMASKVRALVIRETLLGPEDKDTAVSLSNLAWLYEQINLPEEVVPLREQALTILERRLGPAHPYTSAEVMNLAQAYLRRGMVKQAIEMLERLAPDKSGKADRLSADLIGRGTLLGVAYLEAGRQEDAVRQLNRVFDQLVELHQGAQAQAAAMEMERLAGVFQQRRMLEDTVKVLEQLVAWDKAGRPGGRPKPQPGDRDSSNAPADTETGLTDVSVGRATQLGVLYLDLGRLDDAKRVLSETAEQAKVVHGEGTLETFASLMALAQAHEEAGELDAAEKACEKALRVAENKLPRGSRAAGHALNALGRIYTLQKKYELAKFTLEDAGNILEQYRKTEPGVTVHVSRDFGLLHQALGERSDAIKRLRDALGECRDAAGDSPSAHVKAMVAKSIKLLADALAGEGAGDKEKEEAAALRKELRTLLEELRAARALDAEGKEWLKALAAPGA